VCDPYTKTCTNPSVDPTTLQAVCDEWADCLWGQYCAPKDSTTNPTYPINSTCRPGGIRSSPFCSATSYYNPTGECGWTQFCAPANQDEVDMNHAPFQSLTCRQLYSIGEGQMCPPDIGAGTFSIGSSYVQRHPQSFCASGPCLQDGSLSVDPQSGTTASVWRCSKADFTYAGTGCRQTDECGRGLNCSCPITAGGQRYRCMLNPQFELWEMGRVEWFSKLQPWYACLEGNQCTMNSDYLGSCGNRKCANNDQSKQPHTCSVSPISYDPQVNVPNYKGYAATINAGFHAAPSFVIVLLVNILFALL